MSATYIIKPKRYFASDLGKEHLDSLVEIVRNSFGRPEMDYQDIYNHITSPEKVILAHEKRMLLGMASYNKITLAEIPGLIVEGIAISPEMQGKGLFAQLTDCIIGNESIICLRTQSPRMYRALEKYCKVVYPSKEKMPRKIKDAMQSLAEHLNCNANKKGIIKGYYGGLFYGEEPKHEEVGPFFKEIGLETRNGDALLCIGVIK